MVALNGRCLLVSIYFQYFFFFKATAMGPGTVLSARDIVVRKTDKTPCVSRAHIPSPTIRYLVRTVRRERGREGECDCK